VLRGFAFTMLVGIMSGTYSTVFIAAATAILLSQRRSAARTERPSSRPAAVVRPRKPGRKARAS
ncbi:MAG TPA: hypothetical protein QGF05_02980, partial [Dehalococcoidia bacterium]|nr:hypothetical protein [Dehalococcoidia bacterium]